MFAIEDIMEFRRENCDTSRQIAADARRAAIREANVSAASALIGAERSYWNAKLLKAATAKESKEAREQLSMLDELEATSRG